MESDKFITVCDTPVSSSSKGREYVVLDANSGNIVTRQASPADAALCHPVAKIIALRCNSSPSNLPSQY
jgi:hypothetical protein